MKSRLPLLHCYTPTSLLQGKKMFMCKAAGSPEGRKMRQKMCKFLRAVGSKCALGALCCSHSAGDKGDFKSEDLLVFPWMVYVAISQPMLSFFLI